MHLLNCILTLINHRWLSQKPAVSQNFFLTRLLNDNTIQKAPRIKYFQQLPRHSYKQLTRMDKPVFVVNNLINLQVISI